MNTEKNIVIVQYQSSIAMKALVRKLKELDFQLEVMEPDADALKERVPETALFILFLPRERKDGKENLVNFERICDTVQAAGKKIILKLRRSKN